VSDPKRNDPFAELYGEFSDRLRGDRWQPDVDVFETESAVVVLAEIAGIRSEDLRVTVDGEPLSEIDPALWRTQVAWVPQHPSLFHGTVADNLRLARPDATEEELVAAARAANAHGFVTDLPDGYETSIGEDGIRLSGGERQRLAIARACLKDAPLLILDEPTSHLDRDNEALVLEAVSRLVEGRTVLVIAHRPEPIADADLVVSMLAGRVEGIDRPRRTRDGNGRVAPAVLGGQP